MNFNILKAFITWPKFSISSYKIISRLVNQDILPNTVIDVGGNLGQFTIASAKLFKDPLIFTFEPMPKCAEKISQFSKKIKNLSVFPIAIGESPGQVSFQVNSHIQASSILPLASSHLSSFPDAKEIEVIEVEVKTLDSVLAEHEFKSPVLLKIDTQGYEANVIRGASKTLKRVDYVLLEVSFKELFRGEMLFPEILKLMESNHFRFLRPISWFCDPASQEVLQMDALFCRETGNDSI